MDNLLLINQLDVIIVMFISMLSATVQLSSLCVPLDLFRTELIGCRYAVLSFVLVDPQINGVLALLARVSEHGEPLLEWHAEDFHVDDIGVTLRHHPDVVGEYHAWHQVNEVVTPQWNHKHDLHDAGGEREPTETVPAEGVEL